MKREEAQTIRDTFNAFCEGKTVQYSNNGVWRDSTTPTFSASLRWRVKAEADRLKNALSACADVTCTHHSYEVRQLIKCPVCQQKEIERLKGELDSVRENRDSLSLLHSQALVKIDRQRQEIERLNHEYKTLLASSNDIQGKQGDTIDHITREKESAEKDRDEWIACAKSHLEDTVKLTAGFNQHNDEQSEKLESAEKACSAMKTAIDRVIMDHSFGSAPDHNYIRPSTLDLLRSSISTDAGKGFVRREVLEKVFEDLETFRDSVLNGRNELEEPCLNNYQTNAVLGLFDRSISLTAARAELDRTK